MTSEAASTIPHGRAARQLRGVATARCRMRGMTLVEVLVAAAILSVYVAACAAAFALAARLQREATTIALRSAAFEPYVVAAGPSLAALDRCVDAPRRDASAGGALDVDPETGGVCVLEAVACRVAAGVLRCDGGGLRRVRLAWQGSSQRSHATAFEAWTMGPP